MNTSTDYSAEDALHAECCEAIARGNLDVECVEQRRLVAQAQGIAAGLEAENALLAWLLAEARQGSERTEWACLGAMGYEVGLGPTTDRWAARGDVRDWQRDDPSGGWHLVQRTVSVGLWVPVLEADSGNTA